MEFLQFMSKFTVKIWPYLQIRNLRIRNVLWNGSQETLLLRHVLISAEKAVNEVSRLVLISRHLSLRFEQIKSFFTSLLSTYWIGYLPTWVARKGRGGLFLKNCWLKWTALSSFYPSRSFNRLPMYYFKPSIYYYKDRFLVWQLYCKWPYLSKFCRG